MASRAGRLTAMTMALALASNLQLVAQLRDSGDIDPDEAKLAIDAMRAAKNALRAICRE